MRLSLLLWLLIALPVFSSTEIKLGMSAPFSGPTRNLGIELHQGAKVYFEQFNQSQSSYRINLITLDDGYEPNQTIKNTHQLLNEDNVFALFGYVGTPTSSSIMPIIAANQALYFSPYTGADFLRFPVTHNIFNVRASYFTEAELQVRYFIDELDLNHVALFIQADAFGLAAARGYTNALGARGIEVEDVVRYQRNSEDIEQAVAKLSKLAPEVIFCVGTYQPISMLINQLRKEKINSKVVMLSFAGAQSLQSRLTNFDDIYITSVVPDPFHSSLPIVIDYRNAMKQANLPFSHESLEGFIDAAVFSTILNQTRAPVSPAAFIKTAETTPIKVGGLTLKFSSHDRQGLNKAFMNKVTVDGLESIIF